MVQLQELPRAERHASLPDEERGLTSGVAGDAGAEVVRRAEEVVPQDDRGLVPVEAVDRGAAAAGVGLVQHVVVDQRGHVDHLAHGGEGDMLV